MKDRKHAGISLRPRLISLAVASCFVAGTALANPTGPSVVNGTVSVNPAGNVLTVTNSPNSIINWQSFSIGVGETTRFAQQAASSAVLNRVVGALGGRIDPSQILGTLESNGRVFLINPSGIVFGAGSQINVAGLVASSLNLSDADFLGGRLKFTEVPGAGSVVNQGAINAASGGQVYLVGPAVTNSGVITSPKGEVILAAGNSVELVNVGTPNLRVEVSAPDNEARNLGSIVADAGRVGIYAGLINHSGTIRADSAVATEDGRIVLKATRNVTLEAGSVTSASGPAGGSITIQSGDTTLVAGAIEATGSSGRGGNVQVLGNLVGLIDNASINASGETGGGTVLVGGDYQGKNPEVPNAFRTYFGENAKINADAIGSGDGGKVIVWSDDATRAYGTISARGGSRSGDGGFVEVSGRGWLDFHARVDTSAPNGRAGTLLLDPVDVCIYNSSSSACSGEGDNNHNFNSGGLGSSLIFTSSGSGFQSQLKWGSGGLASMLSSTNLVITTSNGSGSGSGNIEIADNLDSINTSRMLKLVANGNINVNGSITNFGTGELQLYAGWNESAMPALGAGNTLQTNPTGSVPVIAGVGNINVNANLAMSGNTTLVAGGNVTVGSNKQVSILSGAGSRTLTLNGGNAVNVMSGGRLKVDVGSGEGGNTPQRAATITILAGAGGVNLNSANVSAIGSGASGGTTGPGGNATINIGTATQPVTGAVAIASSSVINAQAGFGVNNPGGSAQINVFGNAGINFSGATMTATGGGATGSGGSSLIQLSSLGGTGAISVANSSLSATGGNGTSVGGDATFEIFSGAPVSISGSSVTARAGAASAAGGIGGFAELDVFALGNFSMVNSSVFSVGGKGPAFGGDGTTLVVADNIRIQGNGGSSTLFAEGGGTNVGGTPGEGLVGLVIFGENGRVELINDSIQAIGGGVVPVGGSTPVSFGGGFIGILFVDRAQGGFFVNGTEGVLVSGTPVTSPGSPLVSGSGFFVNGQTAVLNQNLLLLYGLSSFFEERLPPFLDAPIISSLLTLTDTLIASKETTGDVGKDEKKKKQAECK